MMTRKKRMLYVAAAAAVLGLVAFAVMVAKDRTYVPSAPYAPRGEPNREVAVVYYSRSGHSEAVAPASTANGGLESASWCGALDFPRVEVCAHTKRCRHREFGRTLAKNLSSPASSAACSSVKW